MSKSPRKASTNVQAGFTLVELLVAIAMLGIVMTAIYSTFKSQQDSYVAQEQVVEMQQNLRASLYMMVKDMRMAGFNPSKKSNVGGVVTRLPSDDRTDANITKTNETHIAFTLDRNFDGEINADDDDEQIAYRLYIDAGNDIYELQKFKVGNDDDEWLTVAENIDALDFEYRDKDGNYITQDVIDNPNVVYADGLSFIDSIRSIEIAIVARTGRQDKSFSGTPKYFNQKGDEVLDAQNDNNRRRFMSVTVLCRNLGT